jgi:hypothetical protein
MKLRSGTWSRTARDTVDTDTPAARAMATWLAKRGCLGKDPSGAAA